MSTRLTHEQREQSFHTALALELALAELPVLRAQFLAALEKKEAELRAQHTRLMAAATTGEDPDARPQQQSLPMEAPASAPSKGSVAVSRKEAPLEPGAPRGGGRPRRRPASESKGEKRVPTVSARTATVAESALQYEDAVPAPSVPCCTCGESLADHTGPTGEVGACHAKKCGAKPRCRAFQLGQVHGWTLRWGGGWKETSDKPVFCLAPPDSLGVSVAFGPLFPHEGSLYSSDPEHPEQVTDALAEARRTGSWSGIPGRRGVPLRVLEAVVSVLVAPPRSVYETAVAPTCEQELPPSVPMEAEGAEIAPGGAAPSVVEWSSVTTEEVSDMRNVRRSLNGAQGHGPRAARVRRIVSVLALAAREESWSHLAGHASWLIVLNPHAERGEVWLSHDRRALGTAGPWRWDGQVLTRAEDWEEPRAWPVKGEPTFNSREALRSMELVLRAALVAAEGAVTPSGDDSSASGSRSRSAS
ncbi:MAG: hypothetical protein ABW123_01380 [Cystobacter sp.]